MTKEREEKPNIMTRIARLITLQLPLLGLLLDVAVYAYFWFNAYYEPRIRYTLKFYFRGHILILALYFVLLLFFVRMYDGLQVGYLKPMDVFLSQMFALIMTNAITYAQISLMVVWMARVRPMLLMTILELLISAAWIWLSDYVYKLVFPPRRLLMVHGTRPIAGILGKFASRPDKYDIVRCMCITEGEETVMQVLEENRKEHGELEGVVIWDIPTVQRNRLLKYCYENNICTYTMPKIPDVLMSGASQLHLFDTPIYMTREYALTFWQRFFKRALDIFCALTLVVVTSPIMLATAIAIKAYDKGPALYSQVRCTIGQRPFRILKFRSMRVDSEKDGVARLASQDDDRITPVGRFIRRVRIDELPQLFNILRGDMSFIGPRPERPEIIAEYVKEMPEFVYRMKVKAGLAGYAQIYGKYNTTPYDKLKLDLTYIQNYSFWLDIRLMLLTLKILLTPDSTEGVEAGQITALSGNEEETYARRDGL